MKVVDAIAHAMKAEGIDVLFAYPVNPLIEAAAKVDIRTVIVRQERIGLHMADAYSRMSSGDKIGVFCMQHGPGAENAFGGVAQAYSESVPILVVPAGYPRRLAHYYPNHHLHQILNLASEGDFLLVGEQGDPADVTQVGTDQINIDTDAAGRGRRF